MDGLPVADTLAKEARDGCDVAREVGQNGFGILYAGEVDDRGVEPAGAITRASLSLQNA